MTGWPKKEEKGGGQIEEGIDINHTCKYISYIELDRI